MMKTLGAFEAKTKLSELLDLVEQGEEITITRHGKPVATLAAPRAQQADRKALDEILRTMDEVRSRDQGFGCIKDLIEEGRRY